MVSDDEWRCGTAQIDPDTCPYEQHTATNALRALGRDLPASRSLVNELLQERQADESRLLRLISGAIVKAVDAHGPITRERAGSAAMRVLAQLEASGVIHPRA